MASTKQKNHIILSQIRLGFFYKVMMTLNGTFAGLVVVAMLYGFINPSDWGIALLFFPVETYVIFPLSIINVIYFSFLLFNKHITKNQRKLFLTILILSAVIAFIGLSIFTAFTAGEF